jgi:hypothetical protein
MTSHNMFKSRHATSLHTQSFFSPDWSLPLWSLWVTLPIILLYPNLSLPLHDTDSFPIYSRCWKKLQSLKGKFTSLSFFLCPHLSLLSLCPSLGHILSKSWHIPPAWPLVGECPPHLFGLASWCLPSHPYGTNLASKSPCCCLHACMQCYTNLWLPFYLSSKIVLLQL